MYIKTFMKFFRGMTRGYGEKLADGTAVNRKEPLTEEIYQAHLDGSKHIGVYCIRDNNDICWACLDVDGVGAKGKAKKLYKKARELGLTPIIECSSSGIGHHLWFCFKKPIPAWQGKLLLEDIRIIAGFGDDPKVEVFPKQNRLKKEGSWGNFVYLPLQGQLKAEKKTTFRKWDKTAPSINASRISTITINELVPLRRDPRKKSSLDGMTAEQIFQEYGVVLEGMEKRGDEVWAICPNPGHEESEGSWSIHNEKLIWHCFGCEKSGYIDQIIKWETGKDIWKDFEKDKKQAQYTENGTSIVKMEGDTIKEIADFGFEIAQFVRTVDTVEEELIRKITFHMENMVSWETEASGEDLTDLRAFTRFYMKILPGNFTGDFKDYRALLKEKQTKAKGIPFGRARRTIGFLENGDFDTANFSIVNKKITNGAVSFLMEKAFMKTNSAPFSTTPGKPRRRKRAEKDLDSILGLFKKAYTDIPIEIALGWCFSAIWTPEIREKYRMFPLLYLTGVAGTGKTCLARNLIGLWGMDQEINLAGTTEEGFSRFLERFAYIPTFVDDIRRIQFRGREKKSDLLRALFDGVGGGKGTTTHGKIDQTTLTGCGLLVGEDLPEDSALYTRSILLNCTKSKFGPATSRAFQSIEELLPEMSRKLRQKLFEKNPENDWYGLQEQIEECRRIYSLHFDHARQALVWAIPTAFFCWYFDTPPTDQLLSRFINQGVEAEEARKEEEPWTDFLRTMDPLVSMHEGNRDTLIQNVDYMFEGANLLIRLDKVWNVWVEARRRRGQDQVGLTVIKKYLHKEGILLKTMNRGKLRYTRRVKFGEVWTEVGEIDLQMAFKKCPGILPETYRNWKS